MEASPIEDMSNDPNTGHDHRFVIDVSRTVFGERPDVSSAVRNSASTSATSTGNRSRTRSGASHGAIPSASRMVIAASGWAYPSAHCAAARAFAEAS